MMKAYQVYKEWGKLAPEQQKYAVGYFLGGVGMYQEGFMGGHLNEENAAYSVKEFEFAILRASEVKCQIEEQRLDWQVARFNVLLNYSDAEFIAARHYLPVLHPVPGIVIFSHKRGMEGKNEILSRKTTLEDAWVSAWELIQKEKQTI